jgi:phage tail sheath protein FI
VSKERVSSVRGRTPLTDLHYGIDFQTEDNDNVFRAIPSNAQGESVGGLSKFYDTGFYLENYLPIEGSEPEERKFSLGFQGGMDGRSIYRTESFGADLTNKNTFGFDFAGDNLSEFEGDSKRSEGYLSYKTAIDLLRPVQLGYDFNLIVTPELNFETHPNTIRAVEKMVRDRGDAYYAFELFGQERTVSEALNFNSNFRSKYAAAYFNWIEPIDGIYEYVPPTALMAATYARSDNLADPWIPAAGNSRGQVVDAKEVRFRLNRSQLDDLYEAEINPINFFQNEGVLAWGDKTYFRDQRSNFDRISVRRLLATIISRFREVSEDLLFEQNTSNVISTYRGVLTDYLANVQARQGLEAFTVSIENEDEGTVIEDPTQLNVSVRLRPVKSAEFVILNFIIEEERVTIAT